MQAHTLPAIRGIYWLLAGVCLYRRNPPLLSMLTFGNMLLALLMSLLPPMGALLLILASPFIITLMANACQLIDQLPARELNAGRLLKTLQPRRAALLKLGGLQLLSIALASFLVEWLLPGLDPAVIENLKEAAATPGQTPDFDLSQLWPLASQLIMVSLLVLPAYWFAPLITAWHDCPPLKAVFFSWVAVWRNWRAFLVYVLHCLGIFVLLPSLLIGLLSLISGNLGSIAASLLQLLALLIIAPVLATGVYCSHREIFIQPQAGAPEPPAAHD